MMLAGQAIMINWSNVAPENRPAYYEWHSREHMVGRIGIPGYLRGRRFMAARASRDFLVLYEVDDLAVLTGPKYLAKANNPSPLTQRTTKLISNSVRALANVRLSLGIGQGAHLLTLRLDPQAGCDAKLGRYLNETLPRLAVMPEIVAAHFCVADKPASTMVPVERQGRPTIVPNWIVMIEGITLDALDRACDALLSAATLCRHGCTDTIERDTYSVQLTVSKMPTVVKEVNIRAEEERLS